MALFDGAFDPFTGGILGRQPPPSMSQGYGVTDALRDYFKGLFPPAQQVEAQFPQTNQMPPQIGGAPTAQQQQPPSSQPAGGNGVGAPLNILAGADFSGNAALPPNSTPTQGVAPPEQQPFANPYSTNDFAGRIARGLSIMDPIAGQAYYSRQLAESQFNALMQQPGMTPGRAIAMMQNPAILQNYYDTKSLGAVKAGPVEGQLISSQGNITPMMPNAGDANDIIQAQAAAQKRGEAQAATQQALPNAIIQAQQAVKLIDDISGDRNLPGVTGVVMGRNPGLTGEQTALIAKIDQLHGQAFLQAWQSLKGAGARITNTEAVKATDAIGRLQRTQGTDGFKAALGDLRGVITDVIKANQYLAQGGQGQNYQPPQQMNAAQFSQDELTAEARRRGLLK